MYSHILQQEQSRKGRETANAHDIAMARLQHERDLDEARRRDRWEFVRAMGGSLGMSPLGDFQGQAAQKPPADDSTLSVSLSEFHGPPKPKNRPGNPAAFSPIKQNAQAQMSGYNAQASQQWPPQQAAPQAGGQGVGMESVLGGQAVNTGNVLGRLEKESQYTPQFGSATGVQGGRDLRKSLAGNSRAQFGRQADAANAQQDSSNQVMKSELARAAMTNQSRIYGDMAQRQTDQLSLATKLQEAMIRNRFALTQALVGG